MSVAPNSSASFWRGTWRLMAMIRSAPRCFAASTPSRPTAPSPTTATVFPGPTSAATAPNQPVAEHIGSREETGDQIWRRHVGGCHERAVGERDARTFGLRSDGADGFAVNARALVAGPTDLARVVGGKERADHELAGLDRADGATDLLDDADVLVTHRSRRLDG